MFAPIVATVLQAGLARPIGRALPPAAGVICLTVGALMTALSAGFMLSVLGVGALVQFPPIARTVGVSASALDATEPLPATPSAIAGVTALVLLILGLRYGVRAVGQLRAAGRLCHELGDGADGLVVIDDERADAFALSGLRAGRIVVSRSMLRALASDERRVLLSHEAAHLHRRHHLFVQLSELAAAANPLLRPVVREVRVGVERWADEVAAAEAGDRQLVARSLARAGLARARPATVAPRAGLGATEVDLQRRVSALLHERPRRRPLITVVLAGLIVALVASSGITAEAAHTRFARADAIFDRR